MIVLAEPPPPPTATHRPSDGENAIDRILPMGVELILTDVQVVPPLFAARYIVLPEVAPARITEKSVLAAKHEMMVLVNVVGDAVLHAATAASASPEYIMRPYELLVDASLPPINQRLYPPPTHNDAHTPAICGEVFRLLPLRFQLKPSLEK